MTDMNDPTPDLRDNQARQSPNHVDAAALLGPQLVLDIQHQGKAAALAGQDVKTCPWATPSPDSSDKDIASQAMWIRGYVAGQTVLRAARQSPNAGPPG